MSYSKDVRSAILATAELLVNAICELVMIKAFMVNFPENKFP